MAVVGRGRIVAWEGASLWVFAGTTDHAETAPHAHHAIQITVGLEGEFRLTTATEGVAGPVAAVAPDVPHVFEARGIAAHLFIEPEGALGRALSARWFAAAHLKALATGPFEDSMLLMRESYRHCSDADLITIGKDMIGALTEGTASTDAEERVTAMIQLINESLDDTVSLSDLAAHVGLSGSRASHLFVEHTGMPLRSYVLWRRLARAVELYSGGSNLTDSAHGAGFADSAHLSRTFRRMFGLPAAALHVTEVEA